MLAFKNDIQFWKNNTSMKGLSVKSIMLNCVAQVLALRASAWVVYVIVYLITSR